MRTVFAPQARKVANQQYEQQKDASNIDRKYDLVQAIEILRIFCAAT
jgi:hypothetical protein